MRSPFFALLILSALASDVAHAAARVRAVDPATVRPTQACVGYIWVDKKLDKYKGLSDKDLDRQLRKRPPEAVIGPGGVVYLLDNHHEFYALLEMRVRRAYVKVIADLSGLTQRRFEARMIDNHWIYFGDEHGNLSHSFATMPQTIASLRDDPYRSLASYLRRAGGFVKTWEPHVEFKWANALRRVVPLRLIQTDLNEALEMALDFSRSQEAADLPGYIGKKKNRRAKAPSCEARLKAPLKG